MSLAYELEQTLKQTPGNFVELSCLIDPQWIAQALHTTGKGSIRRRKLPAEQVIWLVIALALFRNQPIWHIVRQLDLTLGDQAGLCAPSATVAARQRMGAEPLAELFALVSQAWTGQATVAHAFGSLRVLAVDGVVWNTPDSPDNREHFGCCRNQHGDAGWPQVRAVVLSDTHTHELLDAQMGTMREGELTLAAHLQPPDYSLTVFDRAYFSADFLSGWQAAGTQRHWLMRAKDNLRHHVQASLPDGSCLIEMPISARARKLNPQLPEYWCARLIEVELGGKVRRFITSITAHQDYPALQLAKLYAERWEIELGFREIKHSLQQGEFVLRSKQPELVMQELWGTLLAYNLIRRQMKLMAHSIDVPPRQMSFHLCCLSIVNLLRMSPLESAGTLPKQLQALHAQAKHFVLPPRRKRSCPRVVKHKAAKFPRKMKMPVSVK